MLPFGTGENPHIPGNAYPLKPTWVALLLGTTNHQNNMARLVIAPEHRRGSLRSALRLWPRAHPQAGHPEL